MMLGLAHGSPGPPSLASVAVQEERPQLLAKRAKQACNTCRHKKARCTGERPRCQPCVRLSKICSYDDLDASPYSKRARGRERGAFQSAEFTFLLGKIRSLETQVGILTNSVQTSSVPSDSTSSQMAPPAETSSQSSPAVSDTRRDLATRPLEGISPSTLAGLLDTYFQFCHNQPYSFFHESSFRHKMTQGLVPHYLTLAFIATAVRFSTDEFFSEPRDETIATYAAAAWQTLMIRWMAIDEHPSLDIVQAITLLSVIDFTACKRHAAWMKIGLSIRLAQDLRLMLEPPSTDDPVVQEEHRRVFWSIYLIDKAVSIGRARPPAIRDEDCQVALPVDDDQATGDEWRPPATLQQLKMSNNHLEVGRPLSPFALAVITTSVFSDCTRYMIRDAVAREEPPWDPGSPFAAITARLLDLESHFELAESFRDRIQRDCVTNGVLDRSKAGHRLLSTALFKMCACLLHHPLLLRMRLQSCMAKAPLGFQRQTLQNALSDAQMVTQLFQEAEAVGCNTMSSFFGCCMTIAGGVQALYAAHTDTSTRQSASSSLAGTLLYLERLATYWPIAASMVTQLRSFAAHAGAYVEIFDLSKPLELAQPKLERIWCLVDYSAMSTRPHEPAQSARSPTWSDIVWDPMTLTNGEQLRGLQFWDPVSHDDPETVMDDQSTLPPEFGDFAGGGSF